MATVCEYCHFINFQQLVFKMDTILEPQIESETCLCYINAVSL